MAKKCVARTKNDQRCRADAQAGQTLCIFHDPARAADGKRARRAGGLQRSKKVPVLPADAPDHPLRNPHDVSALLADSINRLRRGQLDPKVANAVGYLAGVLLRALEQGPIEERLAQLEAILAKNGPGAEMFSFRSVREIAHEQPPAAPENHRG